MREDFDEFPGPIDGIAIRKHHLRGPVPPRVGDEVLAVQPRLDVLAAKPAREVLWGRYM